MTIFKRKVTTAQAVMEDIVDPDLPLLHLPDVTGEHPASLGDDVNLPLLVREMGGRKKLKLSKRRQELLKELDTIDKELMQLDVLLDAANSLNAKGN